MKCSTVCLLLFFAVPASAQSLRVPETLFLSAAAADWSSTAYCNVNVHCGELNPLIAWSKPSLGTGGMVAIGAGIDALAFTGLRHWGRHHPKAAALVLYASASFRAGLAINNVRIGRMVRGWPSPAPKLPLHTCPAGVIVCP